MAVMAGQDGTLRRRLRAALGEAMKLRDQAAVAALRSALAAIDNAEAVDSSQARTTPSGTIAGGVAGLRAGEAPRRVLDEREIEDIVQREIVARESAAAEYERLCRGDAAARLRAEASVLAKHLSPQA